MNYWDLRVFVFGYRAQNKNSEIMENLYFLVCNTPMHVDLCFDHYFNCLSIKTDINKNALNFIYSEGSKAFKIQIAAAWLALWWNHFNFDVIWTFQYSHFSISGFLMGFRDFRVFVFGYRAQNENPKTTENHYFWVIKLKCMWICFIITNSINLEKSEALKRQIPATWSAMRLNHFEFHVIWTYFKCFESSYYSIMVFLWNFCDFWVFVFGYRAQNENPEITENL